MTEFEENEYTSITCDKNKKVIYLQNRIDAVRMILALHDKIEDED